MRASLDVAKRLRAMSPDFETPFFYFKPYPGSPLTDDAVRGGYVLPARSTNGRASTSSAPSGPWVSPGKHRLVERFKFYQRLAWTPGTPWTRPVRALARWRLRQDAYALPLEKLVGDWLWPQAEMS